MKQEVRKEQRPLPSPLMPIWDPQVEEQLHRVQEKLRLRDAEVDEDTERSFNLLNDKDAF